MIRPGTILWLCIVIAVGYTMFQVKYAVMRQEQTLASLNKRIADDREQLRVLDAEWSYLTRPSRIEELAGRFLHLSNMSAAQIASVSAVPDRAAAASTPNPAALSTPAPTRSQLAAASRRRAQ